MKSALRLVLLLPLTALFSAGIVSAGLYGEHKMIGDAAFERFMAADTARREFLLRHLGLSTITAQCISSGLTAVAIKPWIGGYYGLTYGDINGIAGDHSRDPVEIYFGLLPPSQALFELNDPETGQPACVDVAQLQKALVQAVRLHHNAIMEGERAASNFAFGLDYLLLSYEDESHFHYVGVPAAEELADLDQNLRRLFEEYRAHLFRFRDPVIERLNTTNVSAKYAMLHCAALDMMYSAGALWNTGQQELAITFIRKALLYNGFADHYLQDAFASGHLVVRRGALHALDDNGAHDYYGRIGLRVRNRRGDSWTSFGDGYIDRDSDTYRYAVDAVAVSLEELWTMFERSRSGTTEASPLEKLVDLPQSDVGRTLVAEYGAFDIMPLEVDRDEVAIGNSRGGTFVQAALGSRGDFVTPGSIGIGVGFALRQVNAPDRVRSRESDFAIAGVLGYTNGHLDSDIDVGRWWEFRFGLEGALFDQLLIGIDNGIRHQEGVARWIWNPHIGYEFKPISWSFAPSVHLHYEVIAKRQPVTFVQVQLRYY